MGEISNAVMISASIIKKDIVDIDGVEARFRKASQLVRTEFAWLFDSMSQHQLEDEQFRAAVGALLLVSDDATKERVTYEMKMLDALSCMMRGIPVDMDAIIREDIQPIGLMGIWKETSK